MVSGVSPETQRAIEQRLNEILVSQTWWKRYANTVTAVVSNACLAAWLVVSMGLDLPAALQWIVAAVFFAGNVIGIWKTPNGVTPSLIDLIAGAVVGRHHRL